MTSLQKSAHTRLTRVSLFEWIVGFDTRIVEFGCALRLGQLAATVLSYDAKGRSAAPFLDNALLAFDSGSAVVLTFLAVLCALQMVALAHGTYPKRKWGCEIYIYRCATSASAAIVCAFIVLTMTGLGQPPAVIWGYSLAVLLNGFNAVVLWAKDQDSKDDCGKEVV